MTAFIRDCFDIDPNVLKNITSPIKIDRVVLNDNNNVDENMNLIMSSVFPTVILPFFNMLVLRRKPITI